MLLMACVALTLMPPPVVAQDKVQRVVFASAGFTESNRFWTIARPEHLPLQRRLKLTL
jgi:hypothetical protein